jgi:hypothetical protein
MGREGGVAERPVLETMWGGEEGKEEGRRNGLGELL